MIFLKKYIFTIAAVITVAFMGGCSSSENNSSISESSEEISVHESIPETEPADEDYYQQEQPTETTTEPENHDINLEPAEGTYIYDYAGLLTEDEYNDCNDYAEWVYETYLINIAVVTTNDIEGLTPEQYAEDAYNDLYGGRGSGLLFLLNNDTNEDYLFRSGNCLTYITDEKVKQALYWETKAVVMDMYSMAIRCMTTLAEQCSEYIFDNGGVFTEEQVATLEKACTGSKNSISVLATSNSTDVTNEEICREYYDRRYQDSDGVMIMVDTVTNSLTVISDTVSIPDTTAADELAAGGDYTAAVEMLIESLA
jgi:hypothetical protein